MKPKGYLTPAEIQSFQEISQRVSGVSLTLEEAEGQGIRLIMLFELIIEHEKAHNRKELICPVR